MKASNVILATRRTRQAMRLLLYHSRLVAGDTYYALFRMGIVASVQDFGIVYLKVQIPLEKGHH